MKETDREAVATAVQRVAGMLQRPDQLDKVEQYRRREARKKASVEARLKAAIQSQLDGVRTGLSQLHSALSDVKDIQRSLADVSKDWRQSINTVESLKAVKDAVVRHSQLAAAVENLKNIFSVPEIVRETQDLIEQGALLQAHRKLMDLECSRDGLMYEQYRMDSGNARDMSLIHSYFGSTQALSDELAKQLWMVLQRSLVTVRRDPTLLVSVVRIIEREEKIDRRILDRKKQTGFVPPGRPKNWKEKMFAVLDRTVTTRIEGTQADTRESDRMWLVRHLEIIRKCVLDDLLVARSLMVQCFPPRYQIFRSLLNVYHQALSTRMQELAAEDLEANEIVSLLTWVLNTYTSAEMMGNAELAPDVDVGVLEPLLSPDVVAELLDTYMSTLTSNIIAWLRKALETDRKDWVKETEPEADQDGYYQTTLPAIVFQMFEQNLQVAAQISEDLKTKVLVLCLQQMNSFLSSAINPPICQERSVGPPDTRYKEEAQLYKEEHLRKRQHPHCYVQYMIALINNCWTLRESIVSLKRKYLQHDADESVSLSQPSMDGLLDAIAEEGCSSLLEEVFLDLEQHLNELMTKKWLLGSNAVDIICVTVEDYFNDFAKIKKPYRKRMIAEAHRRVVQEYLRAVLQKRISFRNAEERKEGAERMAREAEQLRFLFHKLAAGFGEEMDGHCDTIVAVAEVIKLTDPSLLYLEVSTLVSKYPDIRDEHIGALLAVRGDASRDMKQTIIETLEQGPAQASPDYVPIFKDIVVPSLNVAKLLK
ncbi:exocyst complex component 3 isoform X1 [Sagmatias obliquidens]|uniref:exocyst complex component 3 isoform X1 n=1 Tax=Sagmatias obliquidens TaxID=3371155 RepID=UPI000F43FEB2|nr:exocyst complex component 3 isoform X1 [Lagenorhynchus obliquidens]XP_026981201.1 exocyst complex component 3 isoform X1 [Lagenorhynchus obliquidens]XP_026981202.1 exocyst complex component 3 isoform X1 [Lagenorhynchus obliquidens]XP_026981203.1 exocyst complex component 3 isoform X1 [Lagenorhynchus obliquidens]XP_026981204.1 exocyst complex component 3 isoform X1 [Lagenorhynchus obliquidens]